MYMTVIVITKVNKPTKTTYFVYVNYFINILYKRLV